MPAVARQLASDLLAEGWTEVTVDPYEWNERAIRGWQKAGFVQISRGHPPDDDHRAPWVLMRFSGYFGHASADDDAHALPRADYRRRTARGHGLRDVPGVRLPVRWIGDRRLIQLVVPVVIPGVITACPLP